MLSFVKYIGRLAPYYLAITIPIFTLLVLNNLLFMRPMHKDAKDKISFELTAESKKEQIAQVLKNYGIVRSSFAIGFLIKKEEDAQGKELSLPAGEYELSPALRPKEIAQSIWNITKISRTLAIKAGENYKEVAHSISASNIFNLETVLNTMTQRALLVKLKLSAGIPEGYFLPGSYSFTKPITPEELIETLVKGSDSKLAAEIPEFKERSKDLKLDPYEVTTLASLLEEENLSEEEKKNFSSLLHNRLILGMPLESVPALNYGINVLKGVNIPLTDADKASANPYNTFIKNKLPVTPICSPSLESIKSILYPNETNYIYFKRNSDGTISYYKNIKEFQENAPS